jgi:hypothetical protein
MVRPVASMNGILYSLRFAGGAEPKDFLPGLSKAIRDRAEHEGPTRTGQFSRLSVFSSAFNQVVDGQVKPHIEYLFLVAGSAGPLPWIVAILETYGAVSFPLGERRWDCSAADDITAA